MKDIHSSASFIIISGIAHLIQPLYGGGKDSGSCASILDHDRGAHVSVCNSVHKHGNEDRSVVCSSVQDHGLTSINRMGCTLTSSPVRQATSIDFVFVYDSLSENCTVVCNSVHEPLGQSGSVVCTNAYSQHRQVNTIQCTDIPVVLIQTGKNTCTAVRKVDIGADFVVCTSLFQDTLKKDKVLCIRIFNQVTQTSSNIRNQVNHPFQEAVKLDCTAFRGKQNAGASLMCSMVFVDSDRSTSCALLYNGHNRSGTVDCTKHDGALSQNSSPDCTITSNMLFCIVVFKKLQNVGSIACFSALRNASKSQVTVCEDLGDHDYVRPCDSLYCSDDQQQFKETGSVPCNFLFSCTSRYGQISCNVLVGTTMDTISIVCSSMLYEEHIEDEDQDDNHKHTTTITDTTMPYEEDSEKIEQDEHQQHTAHLGELYTPPKYAVQEGFFAWLKEKVYAVYDFFCGYLELSS